MTKQDPVTPPLAPTGDDGQIKTSDNNQNTSDTPPLPPPGTKLSLLQEFTPYLFLVLIVVLLCGFLFGYDQGVISGAEAGIQKQFNLGSLGISMVASFVTLGAIIGSLLGGELTHKFGIKRSVTACASLFILGAMIQAFSPNPTILILGRLIVGLGVGIGAVTAPMYAAELAPAKLRGMFISSYQFSITAGIFLAYLINAQLAKEGAWRLMLGMCAAPAILLFIASIFAAESPRWLVLMNRAKEAMTELKKVSRHPHVRHHLEMLREKMRHLKHPQTWSDLFLLKWRKPMIVGLTLSIIQQITGINAVIYYADVIFKAVGLTTEPERMSATIWLVGGVNMAATLVAVLTIDRLGRRFLMLAGLTGMALGLLLLSGGLYYVLKPSPDLSTVAAGKIALVGLIGFIASFAMSVGPVVWTIINEIFPDAVRNRAVALCTSLNWLAAFIVSEFFLLLVQALGISLTFGLFAGISIISLLWVYRHVPETKGKSLDEIQAMWQKTP